MRFVPVLVVGHQFVLLSTADFGDATSATSSPRQRSRRPRAQQTTTVSETRPR
jgi:hypothetical protein